MERIVRKGFMAKDEEGGLLLINEKNEAYKVSESVAIIWHMSDGKSIEELFVEVAKAIDMSVEELREPLTDLIERLKEAELLAFT